MPDDHFLSAMHDVGYNGKVIDLQREMLAMPQAEVPSAFVSAGGIAAKGVLLRAGLTVVGAMHRFENMNVMTRGDITVVTDEGEARYTVTDAPLIIVAPAGAKRAAIVHADTYWISLHPTPKSSLEEVEEEFIVKDEDAFLKMIGK